MKIRYIHIILILFLLFPFAGELKAQIQRISGEVYWITMLLSGGKCSLHRKLGTKPGCCMALCVYEHDALSTGSQPLLSTMKSIRDSSLL